MCVCVKVERMPFYYVSNEHQMSANGIQNELLLLSDNIRDSTK